ncbi:MAG: hypothetical protein LBK40_00960 [Spirochaetaceae bacterium]|jgi:hypothetical protein|nr:hypothetical protein [Spirochaetaceae bacterium]
MRSADITGNRDPAGRRKAAAEYVFMTGLLLMLLGSALLLASMADASRLSVLGSFLVVVIGAVLAALAIKLRRRSLYLFFAAVFIQMGLFLFLSAVRVISEPFSRLWPLLSVFAGLSLIPSGWHRYHAFRSRYMVPAGAFAFLGCILLLFSLKMVPFSFSRFISAWWPLIIVLAGLILILIALSSNNRTED